ncbi:MAG TPA: glycosyl transferase, partial [Thermoanaerobaculia bacterium]|nr:glycosyl transferase [Thermoanaerobaculia bacterium]
GSASLGFLLAALGLRLLVQGTHPIAVVLPLFPFLFDTSVTLLRRIAAREPFLRAHRTHLYQRLTGSGWGHTPVALLFFLLALISGAAALAVARGEASLGLASGLGVLLLHAGVALWISRRSPLVTPG